MKLIVSFDGRDEEVAVERHGDHYQVSIGDTEYAVDVAPGSGIRRSLLVAGAQHEVAVLGGRDGAYRVATAQAAEDVRVLDPLSHLAGLHGGEGGASGPRTVTAYMPGRVVTLLAEEGAEVAAGQGVVVLEAMKMENEIQAEHDGTVLRMLVEEGQAVEGGDPLFELVYGDTAD